MSWNLKLFNLTKSWDIQIEDGDPAETGFNITQASAEWSASQELPIRFDASTFSARLVAANEIDLPELQPGDLFYVAIGVPGSTTQWFRMGGYVTSKNLSIDVGGQGVSLDFTISDALSALDKEFIGEPGPEWLIEPNGTARAYAIAAQAGLTVYPKRSNLTGFTDVTVYAPIDPTGQTLRELLDAYAQSVQILKDDATGISYYLQPQALVSGANDFVPVPYLGFIDAHFFLTQGFTPAITPDLLEYPVRFDQTQFAPDTIQTVVYDAAGEELTLNIDAPGSKLANNQISFQTWNRTTDPLWANILDTLEFHFYMTQESTAADIPDGLVLNTSLIPSGNLASVAAAVGFVQTLQIENLDSAFKYPNIIYPLAGAKYDIANGDMTVTLRPFLAQFIDETAGPRIDSVTYSPRTLGSFTQERFSDLSLV